MAKNVNLDAFIPREDFEIETERKSGKKIDTFSITDIKPHSFFFSSLRKPDFQRETNEWDSQKISELVKSYVDGDLIPAIILWKNAGGYTFVIDGSHRISAIAAWINDDFGDGRISRLFYDGIIPEDQIELAERTRTLIRKNVGSFSEYELALTHPDKVRAEIVERAKSLGTLAIQVQWVEGDAEKAEQSFFKINQQAVPIDRTELKILKARKLANGLAARAIIRSGLGHKYWSKFPEEKQNEIQLLGKEINEILFQPRFKSPVKTLDLPIAGKISSSQSLALILDFINIVNEVNSKESLEPDEDGNDTIKFLRKCRKISQRINSNHPSSLGLHPIVYFYSQDGRHKIASFFGMVALILDFEKKNSYDDFVNTREGFESILLEYDFFVQQIVRKYRSAMKAFPFVKDFYAKVIKELLLKKDKNHAIEKILKTEEFKYLTIPAEGPLQTEGKDFSANTKSAVFITNALSGALKCKICNGYLHTNAISFDHIKRKEEGGLGTFDNAQLTHPYCNSTFKN